MALTVSCKGAIALLIASVFIRGSLYAKLYSCFYPIKQNGRSGHYRTTFIIAPTTHLNWPNVSLREKPLHVNFLLTLKNSK